ncbi:MAG: non-heme iron oxygenase ferredoxin subunit [Elusimicrobia bacterium]|nr:non-heme iron oxygenase ferredoxin subunit [Elusimicrobiota bacterium]
MSRWIKLASSAQVKAGKVKIFEALGTRIALCNSGGQYFAVQDVCSHDDGPLGEGRLCGQEIECPRHGARFDIRSGAATRMPAVVAIRVFKTKVQDGDVLVELEDEAVKA